jgi:hypothetical protein
VKKDRFKYNRAAVSLFKTPKSIKITDEQREKVICAIEKAGSKMALARKAGVHEFTLYCWLVNANGPRKATMAKIEKYLETGEQSPPPKEIKRKLSSVETKNLKNIEIHLKSKKLVYSFKNITDTITLDYSKSDGLRSQAKNIMRRYAEMTGRELEVFKLED